MEKKRGAPRACPERKNFSTGGIVLLGILACFLLVVSCVSASNYYNYVYNGTDWLPMLSDATGVQKVFINNSEAGYLTDNSMADTLHRHSELSASDGTPDRALVVDAAGNVGIGTTSPSGLLNVGKSANTNEVNLSGVMYVNSTSGNVGIGTITPTHELHVVGNANITGNLYLGGNLTDLAEYIFSEGDIEAADVVVISDNIKVKKSDEPYDKAVIGVISTAPAAVFGFGKGDVKLAISGRVPVKVTNENGNIEIGDLLTTSSVPGHAMKCKDIINCFGNIIGKALTPSNEKYGEVIMIVMLN